MAYIITGTRPLVFCANPRTGSTAIAKALQSVGAQLTGSHHGQPFYVPDNSVVFQVVRDHREVINSFWWKSKPGDNFEEFVNLVCSGGYKHIKVPKMYDRLGITHTIHYSDLPDSFEWICMMVGVDPPELMTTPTRTEKSAKEMFSPHLKDKVRETFSEEIQEFGFDFS